MRLIKATLAAIGIGMAAMGIGCSSTPGMSRHDVTVSLAPELTAPGAPLTSVRVDVVAVNSTEASRWENASMSEYWSKPDSLRNSGERYEMAFAPGNTGPKTLKASDPIWNRWGAPNPAQKSGMMLLILADLPGAHQDMMGSQDDRRVVLPLDSNRWDGETPIHITVQQTRLRCDTPPKEPPAKK
jgi:hypothetical protein